MQDAVDGLGDDYRYIMLTLTRPNVPADQLPNEVTELISAYKRMMKNKGIKTRVHGAYRSMELTFNRETNTYHPHFHCLFAVRPSYFHSRLYIKYDRWVDIWNTVNGWNRDEHGYDLQLHVEPVKQGDKGGIAEVCKYITKPISKYDGTSDAEQAIQNLAITTQKYMQGRRLTCASGVIRDQLRLLRGADDLTIGDDELTDEPKAEVKRCMMLKHKDSGKYEFELSYDPNGKQRTIVRG